MDRNNDDGDGFAWALVALLAEGVDRNMSSIALPKMEIVALLAEGVDRNVDDLRGVLMGLGRPPRGGRG